MTRSLSEASRRLDPATDGEIMEDLSKIASFAEQQFGCVFWHPATESLLEDLEFTDTIECMSTQTCRARDVFNLQHVTITAVREAAGSVFPQRVLTTCPAKWCQEYTENRYQMSDPAFQGPVPRKPELLHDFASMSPITADYLRKAYCAGIGPSGLVCWTEVSEGTVVAVVFTSSVTPTEFRRRMERQEWDLVAVAHALAATFARANGLMRTDPARFTDDELTRLRAIASGVSLSRFSGDSVSDDLLLCRRLGARTLTQAAIAAASTGFLSCAPVRLDEICLAKASSPARSECRANRHSQLTSRGSVVARDEVGRYVYEVRKWRKGWAVFCNSERISKVIAGEREAERVCTEMAWGSGYRRTLPHTS